MQQSCQVSCKQLPDIILCSQLFDAIQEVPNLRLLQGKKS